MLHQAVDLKYRHLAHDTTSTGGFQQATRWPGARPPRGGGASRQWRSANGERGAKRQPFGWLLGLGTVPSKVASLIRSTSSRGIEPRSPIVYGCWGSANRSAT